MPKIIDLSLPIADHLRWSVERRQVADFDRYALPLKIPNADGAPARVIAIDGE